MSEFNHQLEEAIQFHVANRLKDAYLIYQRLLLINSDQPILLNWSGILDFQLNRFESALSKLTRALALLPRELKFFCHNSLGNVFASFSELEKARYHYEQVLIHKSDYEPAFSNLALMFRLLEQPELALTMNKQALKLNPHSPDLYFQIGNIFHQQRQLSQAEAFYNQCLSLNMEHAEAHFFLALIKEFYGDDEVARNHFKQAFKKNLVLPITCQNQEYTIEALNSHIHKIKQEPLFSRLKSYSQLLIATYTFPGITRAKQFELCQAWNHLHDFTSKSGFISNDAKVIKVAYISSDFCKSSPSSVLMPLFRYHNAKLFEIYIYSDVEFPDNVSKLFRDLAHVWHDVFLWSDHQIIHQLQIDEIDILVDLSGHTRRNRLSVFSKKPVKVQVTGPGFAATTGLDTMDYCFSSRTLSAPETCQFYSEKVVYLTTPLCWQPPHQSPDLTAPPCVQNEEITFGSGNHLSKLNREVISVWAKILKYLPKSKLYLKAEEFNEPQARFLYQYRFQELGISSDRLRFWGKTTYQEHLKFYNKIDIALDPFPYQGGITTCDTLWMGVPLITLEVAGRLGASLLNLLHLKHYIAKNKKEYIEIALRLASQLDELVLLRKSLRQQLLQSAICDHRGYTLEVESAYQLMIKK